MKPEEIKELRKSVSKSQEDFAGILGVSRITVSRWETGAQRPIEHHLQQLQQMDRAYRVNLRQHHLSGILRGLISRIREWAWYKFVEWFVYKKRR